MFFLFPAFMDTPSKKPFHSDVLNAVVERAAAGPSLATLQELYCMQRDPSGNVRSLLQKIEESLLIDMPEKDGASLDEKITYQEVLVEGLDTVRRRVEHVLTVCGTKNLLSHIDSKAKLQVAAVQEWKRREGIPATLQHAYSEGHAYGVYPDTEDWIRMDGEGVVLGDRVKIMVDVMNAYEGLLKAIMDMREKIQSLRNSQNRRNAQALDIDFGEFTLTQPTEAEAAGTHSS